MGRRKSAQKMPSIFDEKVLLIDQDDALLAMKILAIVKNVQKYKCGDIEIFDFKDSNDFIIAHQGRKYAVYVSKDATDEEIFDGLAKIARKKPELVAALRDMKCKVYDPVLKDRLAFIVTSISMLTA